MRLNIKNAETLRLARELAELTGESLTDAVMQALRERLDRVKKQGKLSDRLLEIGDECAARLKKQSRKEHGDLLFDSKGLPK